MIKKIGILTSGGDSQGMNNTIRAAARAALNANVKVALIYNGFKGLVENKISEAVARDFSNILNKGGTFIGAARLPEFEQLEIRQKAVENLKKHGIDALVVIGGDGSFKGALKLSEMGINCIGIPGTIDNDIDSTDYTVGFDSALNVIVDAIDKIRDTAQSHARCMIVEVMGRYCGDLALNASIATGADVVVTPENKISEDEIIKKLLLDKNKVKSSTLVIVTEYMFDIKKLAKKIEHKTGLSARPTVLGHIQRGGSPTAFDRVLAARLGVGAVDALIKGKSGFYMGIVNNEIKCIPINNASLKNTKINDELNYINKEII